jgi:urease gamma subunit
MRTKIGTLALGCLTATGCATNEQALETFDATKKIEIHLTQEELDQLKEQCNGFVAKNGRAVTLSTKDYPNISKVVGSNLGECTIIEENGKFQLSPLSTNIVKPASENTKTVTISFDDQPKVKSVTDSLSPEDLAFFENMDTTDERAAKRLKQETLKNQQATARLAKKTAEEKKALAEEKAVDVFSKALEIIENAQEGKNENDMLKGLKQILRSLNMNHSNVAELSGEDIKKLISAIQTNHDYKHNNSIKDMIEKILEEINKPKQIRLTS